MKEELASYLILNALVFVLGIIAFRNRYHAVPAKSVFPVVLAFCLISLFPFIIILATTGDVHASLIPFLASGMAIFMFWVWTTLEILIKNIRNSTFSQILTDIGQTIFPVMVLVAMFLWLTTIPFGKIGG